MARLSVDPRLYNTDAELLLRRYSRGDQVVSPDEIKEFAQQHAARLASDGKKSIACVCEISDTT
jgi:hypothetical protein